MQARAKPLPSCGEKRPTGQRTQSRLPSGLTRPGGHGSSPSDSTANQARTAQADGSEPIGGEKCSANPIGVEHFSPTDGHFQLVDGAWVPSPLPRRAGRHSIWLLAHGAVQRAGVRCCGARRTPPRPPPCATADHVRTRRVPATCGRAASLFHGRALLPSGQRWRDVLQGHCHAGAEHGVHGSSATSPQVRARTVQTAASRWQSRRGYI